MALFLFLFLFLFLLGSPVALVLLRAVPF